MDVDKEQRISNKQLYAKFAERRFETAAKGRRVHGFVWTTMPIYFITCPTELFVHRFPCTQALLALII